MRGIYDKRVMLRETDVFLRAHVAPDLFFFFLFSALSLSSFYSITNKHKVFTTTNALKVPPQPPKTQLY